MIGASVQKGYDSVMEGRTSLLAILTQANITNNTYITTTLPDIGTSNYTGSSIISASGGQGGAENDDTNGMSPEELGIRLEFAVSLTFMVGLIQVSSLNILTHFKQRNIIAEGTFDNII